MPVTDKHPKGWTVWHSARALTQNYADNKYYSPYIKPIKTGTIDEAGRNLVTMGTDKGAIIFLSVCMHRLPTKTVTRLLIILPIWTIKHLQMGV